MSRHRDAHEARGDDVRLLLCPLWQAGRVDIAYDLQRDDVPRFQAVVAAMGPYLP